MIRNPPKIIIAGAPASGKGTQCEFIREYFNVVHLSTGDILRSAAEHKTEMGLLAKSFMDKGQLVPDDVIIGVVLARMNEDDCMLNGWLLDGFPRTAAQAVALLEAGLKCDKFIFLDVPDSALVERVVGRRSDPVTGKIYHVKYSPPESQEILARLIQRSDDTEEKVKVRIQAFHSNMSQIMTHFKSELYHLNGNRNPKIIWNELSLALHRDCKYSVLFVVGAKGSGKKTLCNGISDRYGLVHIHIPNLISEERYNSSKTWDVINKYISSGEMIPGKLLIELIIKAMKQITGSKRFVVDSFPRNVQDMEDWYDMAGEGCLVDHILYLTCKQETLFERMTLNDGSAMQLAAIAKAYKQFQEEVIPVIAAMRLMGKVREIATHPKIELVHNKIRPHIDGLTLVPMYERSIVVVKPDGVGSGHIPTILRAIATANIAVIAVKFVLMTDEVIRKYYNKFESESQFETFVNFMKSGPSLLIFCEGSNSINRLQNMIGPSNPSVAKKENPSSIRALYGTDHIRNVCDTSGSTYDAFQQICFWSNPININLETSPPAITKHAVSDKDMVIEDTLAIIKPGAADLHANEIISIIMAHGFEIMCRVEVLLSTNDAFEFYSEHKEKDFFPGLVEYMSSGPIIALHLRRQSAIIGWRHLIGLSDFHQCKNERPDSIRGKYAVNGRMNTVHGSDSIPSSVRELSFFFPLYSRAQSQKAILTSVSNYSSAGQNMLAGADRSNRIAREAKRRERNAAAQEFNISKHANMLTYLNDEVNPLLRDLVESVIVKRPKDITGFLIKTLAERQKKSNETQEMTNVTKLRPIQSKNNGSMSNMSVSKSVDCLNLSKAVSIQDESFYGVPEDEYLPTYNGKQLTVELAMTEISELKKALQSAGDNLLTQKWTINNPPPLTEQLSTITSLDSHEPPPRHLGIIHMSDIFGYGRTVESVTSTDVLARVCTDIKNFLEKKNVMLFSGNFLSPSTNYNHDHVIKMFEIIHEFGVSYGILGHLDYSYGVKVLNNHVKNSTVTWILSNVKDSQTKKPLAKCEEYVLVEWNSVKVGIIGLVDNWLAMCPNMSETEYIFMDIVKTATTVSTKLISEGAEFIIAMTHCSEGVDETISRIPGINLVLGGHCNSPEMWKLINGQCAIKSTGCSSITQVMANISYVPVQLQGQQRPVVDIVWPPVRLEVYKDTPSAISVLSILDELRYISHANLSIPIGETAVSLKGSIELVRSAECALGNLLADILKQYNFGTHIAFINGGAIRIGQNIPPKVLTVEDIFRILPFNDYFATVELTGRQVQSLLETSVSKTPYANGRFCHISTGLMCVYAYHEKKRVQSVTIWNNAIEENAIYSCVMPGYMAEGLSGFKVLTGCNLVKPKEFCPSLYSVIFDFFKKRNASVPQSADENGVKFDVLKPRVNNRYKLVGDKYRPVLSAFDDDLDEDIVTTNSSVIELHGEEGEDGIEDAGSVDAVCDMSINSMLQDQEN